MKNQDSLVVEIDLLSLLKALWRKKFLIFLAAIIFGLLSFTYSSFIAVPKYSSTTRIYVISQQNSDSEGLSNQDLQAGSYLVKDYKEIILSRDVLEQVISDLNLGITPNDLLRKIEVSVPVDTRIVSITVTDADANEASRIANSLRESAATKIISVTKVSDVTTLEKAKPASIPSSPNVQRSILLGTLSGVFLMIVAVLVVELLDDRVKQPEDIEDILGLPLLGMIPDVDKIDRR